MGKTKKTGDLVNVVVTDASNNVTLPKALTIGEEPLSTDDSLKVPSTSWVNDKLDTKVDKVAGKVLSTNDFTDLLKTKLDGIQAGAEVNVNADWNATSGDAQILNKPAIEPPITAGTNLQYFRGDKTFQTLNTSVVPEVTNLYYTEARVNANTNVAANTAARHNAVTLGTANGLSLSTQVLSLGLASSSANGALSSTDWATFNAKQNALTLTVTGNNGAATLVGSTLNIPTYTLAGLGGQTALNGTGFVKVSGTTVSYDNNTYLTTISGITAGGELSGTYPNPTLVNSAVTGKVLSGVNITGGTIQATDNILTAFGKLQNQINGLVGSTIYQGTWNASTNTPTLTSSVGTNGHYYIVSVAGTTALNGVNSWAVGDWVIFSGNAWQKVDNTDSVVSVNGFTGAVSLTTSNINEGTNLYFTNARTIASVLNGYVSGTGTISATDTVLSAIQKLNGNIGALTTTNITEGTNLYYTDARVRAALSFAAGSGAYNSTTGVITIPTNNNQITNGAGYITTAALSGFVPYTGATANVNLNSFTLLAKDLVINHSSGSGVAASITKGGSGEALTVVKSSGSGNAASITGGVTLISDLHTTTAIADAYIASAANWNAAFNLRHNAVTIGTANGLSLSTQVLSLGLASGSANGALSSTDWNTFNNKQNALTNPITGSLTTNFIPKATGATTLGNSALQEVNGNLGLGVTPSAWASGFRAIQMTSGTSLMSNPSVPITYLSANYLATDAGPRYIQSDGAARFLVNGWQSQFVWEIAPSGTAGNAISFTQAMTLGANGNLLLGTTTDSTKNITVYGASEGAILMQNSNSGTGAVNGLYIGRLNAENYLWAYENEPLIFATNNAERMRITSGGNVGIGTTSPTSRLHVVDAANFFVARFTGGGSANSLTAGTAEGTPSIAGYSSAGASSNVSINPYGGNVGIGTTTDAGYKLDVNGTGRFGGNVAINGTASSLDINPTTGQPNITLRSGNTFRGYIEGNASGGMDFGTGASAAIRLSIASTGAATFSSSVTASGNAATTPSFIANNVSGAGGTAQHYIDFTAGATVISRMSRGNGASGLVANGLNIDNFDGFGIRLNQLGGSGGNFIVTGGNVGIGTTSPASRLHLLQSSNTALTIQGDASEGNTFINFSAESSNLTKAQIQGARDSALGGRILIHTTNSSGTLVERLRIAETGNVGIGTTSPTFSNGSGLVVHSDGASRIKLSNPTSGQGATDGFELIMAGVDAYVYNYEAGPMIFGAGNAERMRITSGGNVGIGTTSPIYKLEVLGNISINGGTFLDFANGDLRFVNSSGTLSIQTYSLSTGLTTKATITGTGNVGIGTTSPSERLHVVGNGLFSGSVTASGFFQSSDERLKDIISTDGDMITYKWKDGRDDKLHYGYSAQQTEKINPNLVSKGADGMLAVNYTEALVLKVRELEKQVELLKAQIN